MTREQMIAALISFNSGDEYDLHLAKFLRKVESCSDSRIKREYEKYFPEKSEELRAYETVAKAVSIISGIESDISKIGEGSLFDAFAYSDADKKADNAYKTALEAKRAFYLDIIKENADLARGWAKFIRDKHVLSYL